MAEYPIPKHHFQVEWGGTKIGFTEVTGLSFTTEKLEYRDGASKEYSKIAMPGMRTHSDLTLKRGVFAGDNEFHEWWNTVSLNTIERRDITISLLNENHEPVVVWKVKNAWPLKVTPTDLNSTASDVGVEEIQLAHEGLETEHP